MEQYAGIYLLQYHCTCFGCCPHPSSGVHKTVVTATGTSHMIVQLPHCNVAKLGLIWEARVGSLYESVQQF